MPAIGSHMQCSASRTNGQIQIWRARKGSPSPSKVRAYEVVHKPAVVIRSAPSIAAAPLGHRGFGERVHIDVVESGWVRLAKPVGGQYGWMLIDGAELNLGKLLEPCAASASLDHKALQYEGEGQQRVVILRNGARMPLMGLGTGGVPGLEGAHATSLIEHALRHCGVRLVDTAADYANEEAVGEGIRRSGVAREELFVVTKLGPLAQGYARASSSIERSLRRLQLEYIDLVLIHWPGASLHAHDGRREVCRCEVCLRRLRALAATLDAFVLTSAA